MTEEKRDNQGMDKKLTEETDRYAIEKKTGYFRDTKTKKN